MLDVKYELEKSKAAMDAYFNYWKESMRELEECLRTGQFDKAEIVKENCLYYEEKYIKAFKKRNTYLFIAEGLGLK